MTFVHSVHSRSTSGAQLERGQRQCISKCISPASSREGALRLAPQVGADVGGIGTAGRRYFRHSACLSSLEGYSAKSFMTFRTDFVAGAKAISPLLPPGATVGLVTGVAAASTGLSLLQGLSMSVILHSATVMLTAVSLLQSGAPEIVLIVAPLIVGVRFMLLSVSIAPYLKRVEPRSKWFMAYFLWTPTYALSIERYEAEPQTDKRGYFLGAAIPLWLTFQSALVVGLVFGTRVPARWHLGYVIPLAFIGLLMRMINGRASKATAIAAGVTAVIASALPLNVGIVISALVGTAVGVLVTEGDD